MRSAALRLWRTPERIRNTARTFVAVTAIVASCASALAQPQRIATAKYSGGECRLRLQSAVQEISPENRKKTIVVLEFYLEFPESGKATFTSQLPAGLFLNNDKSPLLSAAAGTTKNVVGAHVGTAEGREGLVLIRDLDVGTPRDQLKDVELELVLVKVSEWDQLKFSGLKNEVGDFLPCGPFEYRLHGSNDQVRLDGWAFPKYRAEQEAYRKKMPLKFINDDYALQEVKLVDAAGRSPTGKSLSTGGTGASFGIYSTWRPANAEAPEAAATNASSDEITYPITLTVQLPKRFTTERVRFRFNDIPLPAAR
jgi:hypothetical protein